MKKLEVRFTRGVGDSLHVGTLAEDRGRVYFEYAPAFLNTGLNLSPFRLPFEAGLFEHNDREFGPLPGVFDDSLPDGWGLLLMDRHFRSQGLNPRGISPLDRLSWLGTRTMGALTYHPPTDRENVDATTFDLHDLARQSQELLTGAAVDVLPQLLRAGGSPGGARPKVLVGLNPDTDGVISGEDDLPAGYEHWIVKFAADTDSPDAGAVEYAYSLMATAAGIDMPPTRLFTTSESDRFFGVKRFDRSSTNRRYHIHTFGNLIQSNFRIPSADYADLLKATSLLTRNHQDVLRAFRRMAFNVLAHNRDDHVKNFAFLLNDATNDWTLSPAYDLLHTPGLGPNAPPLSHTMTIVGEGKHPARPHMLRLAEQSNISTRDAIAIIDEVHSAITRWSTFATKAKVSPAITRQLAKSLTKLAQTAEYPKLSKRVEKSLKNLGNHKESSDCDNNVGETEFAEG
ncbi:MAG: type II toxin-antitoxin system HipA family toxin [Phycisphaerales bacterium]|nr:type II toxin-antitoxin system HipA family toxin [Phycisphaerales bacterium]